MKPGHNFEQAAKAKSGFLRMPSKPRQCEVPLKPGTHIACGSV